MAVIRSLVLFTEHVYKYHQRHGHIDIITLVHVVVTVVITKHTTS